MSRKKKIEVVKDTTKTDLNKIHDLLKLSGSKYATLNVYEYKDSLDRMSINELYDEALRVGLKAYGERNLTTRTLIDLFNEYVAQNVPSFYSSSTINSHLSDEKKQTILDLMKDAR